MLLPFFSLMSYLIAVPTGVKFFNWIGTMWKGQISFETPMLFAIGFLVTFLLGGLTGVLLASPPVDWHVTDSYFVVAHFHYVLFGTIVFAAFGGVYFWFPKMTGRMLDERLGKLHFWTMFVGFHGTFLVQHWLGNEGFPRRYADYRPPDGFTELNMVSTISSFVLGASTLFFIYNVWKSYRFGRMVAVDDPWGFGNSLEWATSLPTAAAQLRPDAPDPLRAPGLRRQVRSTRRRSGSGPATTLDEAAAGHPVRAASRGAPRLGEVKPGRRARRSRGHPLATRSAFRCPADRGAGAGGGTPTELRAGRAGRAPRCRPGRSGTADAGGPVGRHRTTTRREGR